MRKTTITEFIEKSNTVHGARYDYSNIEFIDGRKKVFITCKLHGDFLQSPHHHMEGRGCPQCGKRHTNQKFDCNSRLVHGDLYDYSKVDYITNKIDVIITCKIHGDFTQNPWNHLKGHGCAKCNWIGRYTESFFSKYDTMKNKKAMLYIVEFSNQFEKFHKIGITCKTLVKRFEKNKQYAVKLIKSYNGELYSLFKVEQNILKKFVYRNRHTPIDFIGGDKECFKPCPHLLDVILQELESQLQTTCNS